MEINLYSEEDIVILELVGKILPGPDVGELDQMLYSLLCDEQKKVIIDMGKSAWLSSSAIGILVHHWKKFKQVGGNLRLANLSKKIQELVAISGLAKVLEIYDNLGAALDSFKN
jgi:anti-sigma B factor antagonist